MFSKGLARWLGAGALDYCREVEESGLVQPDKGISLWEGYHSSLVSPVRRLSGRQSRVPQWPMSGEWETNDQNGNKRNPDFRYRKPFSSLGTRGSSCQEKFFSLHSGRLFILSWMKPVTTWCTLVVVPLSMTTDLVGSFHTWVTWWFNDSVSPPWRK